MNICRGKKRTKLIKNPAARKDIYTEIASRLAVG